jgi:hypothetical protein
MSVRPRLSHRSSPVRQRPPRVLHTALNNESSGAEHKYINRRLILIDPTVREKTTLSRAVTKSRAPDRDRVAFQRFCVVEVDLLERRAGGKPRGADPATRGTRAPRERRRQYWRGVPAQNPVPPVVVLRAAADPDHRPLPRLRSGHAGVRRATVHPGDCVHRLAHRRLHYLPALLGVARDPGALPQPVHAVGAGPDASH